MKNTFIRCKSDTAVALCLGLVMVFAVPYSAQALTRADQKKLDACELALKTESFEEKYYDVDLSPDDYLGAASGYTNGLRMEQIRETAKWFMTQPDPEAAAKEWAEWAKKTKTSTGVDLSETEQVLSGQAARAQLTNEIMARYPFTRSGGSHEEDYAAWEAMIQEKVNAELAKNPKPTAKVDITDDKVKMTKVADALIAEVKRLAEAKRNGEAARPLCGLGTGVDCNVTAPATAALDNAIKQWEQHSIANCSHITDPVSHLRCTGNRPTIDRFITDGAQSVNNYVRNPEIIVTSINDLTSHPAYAKMTSSEQATIRAQLQKALNAKAAGTMGGSAISEVSSQNDCTVDKCFKFTVVNNNVNYVPAHIAGGAGSNAGAKQQYTVRTAADLEHVPFIKDMSPQDKAIWAKQVNDALNNPGDNDIVFEDGASRLVIPGKASRNHQIVQD